MIRFCLLLVCLNLLVSCGQINIGNQISDRLSNNIFTENTNANIGEVATPKVIKQLNQDLEKYNPQVKIISPRAQQIFEQTEVSIKLQVEDLPIFQDDKFKLGNHLTLILDNESARSIYDLEEQVSLKNLAPGTHSIRVFASRPWGESFKNEGAYAQTTFSVLTETNDNRPDSTLPLLTYNEPTGTYGAEPFLLDFYLTNAPLHSFAKNNPDLQDWQVRATVNGESFLLENWQSAYLTGLNPGKNWIQLELLDELGNGIENTFNNTVRVINYDPEQKDNLAKLVSNKIDLAVAKSIVEPNYSLQSENTSEIVEPKVRTEEAQEELEPSINRDKITESRESVVKTVETEAKNLALESQTEDSYGVISRPVEKVNEPQKIEQIKAPETSPLPPLDSESESKKIEESIKRLPDNEQVKLQNTELETVKTNEEVELTASQSKITTSEKNLDLPATIDNINISQADSVEITKDESAISTSSQGSNSAPDKVNSAPLWWKKILVGLRQKLEGLVKLLPSKV